jgi:hypothetical protein
MKIILLALVIGVASSAYSQDSTPCCTIIGINPGTNSITARNNATGQLFTFRAEPLDMQNLKLSDAVTTNESFTYVTAINKLPKQYFAGPVNLLQVKSKDALGLVNLNYEEPCCKIITIENSDPCCNRVSAQNSSSGNIFQFTIPKEMAAFIKKGDPVYTETVQGFAPYAIIQNRYNSTTAATNVFAFTIDAPQMPGTGLLISDSWVMTQLNNVDGDFGKLNTDFPDDVEWGIDIYTHPDRTLMMNRNPKEKQKSYDMAPGNYDFKLNNVMVTNVPVEKGKETRLKAGYLKINAEENWSLLDASQATVLYSGTTAKTIALPVGSYFLKKAGQTYALNIRDGETSAF